MSIAMLQEQMKRITTLALKQSEMDERYLRKREFLILNEVDEIPEEHSVKRWGHFLPPLVPISLSATTVAPDFKESILSAMRKGSKHQHADELALQSKIAQFGFSIISSIQKIVLNKELLLSSASTGTPFLQNVCCSEKERVPLLYFAEEDPDVLKWAKAAKALGTLRSTIRSFSKAAFLFDPRGRLWEYPPISSEITESNLYDAFIHYCQLTRGAVPHKFRAFFTDVPAGFPAKASLDEQIAFLKRHDKRFTPAQLSELLQIVHKENIIHMDKPVPYHRSEVLKDLMNLFDQHESPVIDRDVREHIQEVLDRYDKTKLVSVSKEDDPEDVKPEPEKQKVAALKALKNTLAETIRDQFKPSVLAFFRKYGKVAPLEMTRLTQFMDTFVSSWATPDLYQIANFVKNTIYEMTSVFPQVLITNQTNVSRVHKYWALAEVDSTRIYRSIKGYYEPLGEFRQDPVLIRLLLHIQPKFVDLRLFFENLPIQEAIQVGGRDYYSFFDKDTVKLLLEYIFLSVLHEYIIATDERELLQLDQVEKKRTNRKRIAENGEPTLSSEFPELEEEYEQVYGDMLEIQIQAGNRDELKTRVAKMLLSFISITRKNKEEIDISYENIATAIRKRKEKEKNRIIEKFKNMSEDERKIEDMKKRLKMDEWNVGTQRGIFKYDQATSSREVMEQKTEEALEIKKHGIRAADFVSIHATEEDEPVREMLEVDELEEVEADADTGIQTLKKGFDDGRFYSDDESDDDFGDD